MKTGIVFEVKGPRATLMKSNGEFVSVRARKKWKKGDVVNIGITAVNASAWYATAACFVLFFSLVAVFASMYFTRTSLISMDVNPSIELTLNRWDRVIDADAYNDEGGEILAYVNLKNKKYTNALSELIESNEMSGYISNNSNVTFTVNSTDESKEYVILDVLQGVIGSEIAAHHNNANVEIYIVDSQFVQEAHGHHVTAGKYKALVELQEADSTVNVDDYTHHNITDIKARINNHNVSGDEHNNGQQNKHRSGHN